MKTSENFVDEQGPVLEPDVPVEATLVSFGDPYTDRFNPDKEKYVWRFEVQTDEGPAEAAAFVTISTFESDDMASNMVKFARALNGGELPLDADGQFDDELLIGKKGRIIPGNYYKGEIEKNKVKNVLPLKRRV